jgi:hypothetical protein
MNRPLFMPDKHVPDVGFQQFIVNVNHGAPRISEDRFNAFLLENFHQYLCTCHFHVSASLDGLQAHIVRKDCRPAREFKADTHHFLIDLNSVKRFPHHRTTAPWLADETDLA